VSCRARVVRSVRFADDVIQHSLISSAVCSTRRQACVLHFGKRAVSVRVLVGDRCAAIQSVASGEDEIVFAAIHSVASDAESACVEPLATTAPVDSATINKNFFKLLCVKLGDDQEEFPVNSRAAPMVGCKCAQMMKVPVPKSALDGSVWCARTNVRSQGCPHHVTRGQHFRRATHGKEHPSVYACSSSICPFWCRAARIALRCEHHASRLPALSALTSSFPLRTQRTNAQPTPGPGLNHSRRPLRFKTSIQRRWCRKSGSSRGDLSLRSPACHKSLTASSTLPQNACAVQRNAYGALADVHHRQRSRISVCLLLRQHVS
jgi:hypothetical protein